jgi:hypothetical protein
MWGFKGKSEPIKALIIKQMQYICSNLNTALVVHNICNAGLLTYNGTPVASTRQGSE